MKKIQFTLLLFIGLAVAASGCADQLRFAPSEQQKQTSLLTADLAKEIDSSGTEPGTTVTKQLVKGTRAATLYMGLPKTPADPQEFDVVADKATADAVDRPDPWTVADNLLVLAGGVATVFGGVGAGRIVSAIGTLRQKAKALNEVVIGNELLKTNGYNWKAAHAGQSANTQTLVAGIKAKNPVLRMPPMVLPRTAGPGPGPGRPPIPGPGGQQPGPGEPPGKPEPVIT